MSLEESIPPESQPPDNTHHNNKMSQEHDFDWSNIKPHSSALDFTQPSEDDVDFVVNEKIDTVSRREVAPRVETNTIEEDPFAGKADFIPGNTDKNKKQTSDGERKGVLTDALNFNPDQKQTKEYLDKNRKELHKEGWNDRQIDALMQRGGNEVGQKPEDVILNDPDMSRSKLDTNQQRGTPPAAPERRSDVVVDAIDEDPYRYVGDTGERMSDTDPEYLIIRGWEKISPQERGSVVNQFLEKVEVEYGEISINSLPGNIGKAMRTLEGVIKRYDQAPEKSPLDVVTVKLAKARVRVHDMNAALLFLNFKPEDIKGDVRTKLQNITASQRVIDGEDLALLFKGKIDIERYKNIEFGEKFPVGAALNVLQEASVYGIDGLRWGDKKLQSEDLRLLTEKIKARLPESCDKDATLRLADRLARITFEASVWNTDASDPIAQVFHMEASRRDVINKISTATTVAEDYGPGITVDMVPGFGTSLIRRANYKVNGVDTRLVNDDHWKQAVALMNKAGNDPDLVAQSINTALSVNRVSRQNSNNLLIDYTKLNCEKLPGNVFTDYYQKYLPAIKTAESYLLKSDWKPSDFNRDKINDMYISFGYADPDSIFYLKGTFIYGVLMENLSSTSIEQSTKGTFKDANALEAFLRVLVTPTQGQKITFMTREELKSIRKQVKPMLKAEMQSFFDDAFGKVIKTSQ